MNISRNDVGPSVLPLYHCAELHIGPFSRVHRGATTVIHHDFEPAHALQAIEEHGVTTA